MDDLPPHSTYYDYAQRSRDRGATDIQTYTIDRGGGAGVGVGGVCCSIPVNGAFGHVGDFC